jgi:hypothetical protein
VSNGAGWHKGVEKFPSDISGHYKLDASDNFIFLCLVIKHDEHMTFEVFMMVVIIMNMYETVYVLIR